MTLVPISVLLLMASTLGPPAYRTYHNQRYGYRIDYPADMSPQPEAFNGDGRQFVSADGQTILSAFSSYNALDGGLAEYRIIARQSWQKEHVTLSLDQPTRTGYVMSGQAKGAIFYQKTVLKSNMLTTFIWKYPASRKAAMDAVIQHTIRTLKPSISDED